MSFFYGSDIKLENFKHGLKDVATDVSGDLAVVGVTYERWRETIENEEHEVLAGAVSVEVDNKIILQVLGAWQDADHVGQNLYIGNINEIERVNGIIQLRSVPTAGTLYVSYVTAGNNNTEMLEQMIERISKIRARYYPIPGQFNPNDPSLKIDADRNSPNYGERYYEGDFDQFNHPEVGSILHILFNFGNQSWVPIFVNLFSNDIINQIRGLEELIGVTVNFNSTTLDLIFEVKALGMQDIIRKGVNIGNV